MNEEPEEEWSQEDLPEGFDVYDYDAKRARAGQLMVVCIFAFAFLMFVLAMYFSYRDLKQWQKDHPGQVQTKNGPGGHYVSPGTFSRPQLGFGEAESITSSDSSSYPKQVPDRLR